MDEIVEYTARFIEGFRIAHAKKWSFLGIFVLIFAGSTIALAQLDLLPNDPFATNDIAGAISNDLTKSSLNSLATTVVPIPAIEEPIKITISSIGLSATVANPTSTDASVLDELLLKGAVRYPTSAKLGETGNVVLFGHSSYLPIVGNQAYKTFNEIQKLKKGDLVTVSSSGTAYTYVVRTVAKENANNDIIPLSVSGRVLTLATCNSFGLKSDRFVVTADFVESHVLGA